MGGAQGTGAPRPPLFHFHPRETKEGAPPPFIAPRLTMTWPRQRGLRKISCRVALGLITIVLMIQVRMNSTALLSRRRNLVLNVRGSLAATLKQGGFAVMTGRSAPEAARFEREECRIMRDRLLRKLKRAVHGWASG